MAVISVEVPEVIANKFKPYKIIQWQELSLEEQLLKEDWEGWETVVDFEKWVDISEVLDVLKNG